MTDKNLKINTEKCIHCGLCINDCMAHCLKFDKDKIPTFSRGGEDRCIECQHCLAICPVGALSILNKNPEDSKQVPNTWNSDEILNLIKSRRSFRNYKNENLDEETLNKLKNMLNWVPTGVNNHRLHFSFIDDKEVMEEFRNNVNQKLLKFLKSTPIRSIKQKFSRYITSIMAGKDVIFRGAPHLIVISSPLDAPCPNVDPIIALSYFELYAQSLGVATVWCGLAHGTIMLFPEICEQLEIPENHKVSYVMLFGPPNVKYARTTQPEPYNIVSVKKLSNEKIGFMKKLKRFFWNIAR